MPRSRTEPQISQFPVNAPKTVKHPHPLFWPGREYGRRPNLGAIRRGAGGGRSLVLSDHMDGNRLYGRGAVDMKAGIASNLFVVEALSELGIALAGDLTFEAVVDEEFGGVNGTLAGRLMGYNGDAAILSEPTAVRVCPAQRGGRMIHLTFTAPNGGILAPTGGAGVTEQLRLFLNALPEFVRLRRAEAPAHPLYAHLDDPVPVTVARIHTAPWGT